MQFNILKELERLDRDLLDLLKERVNLYSGYLRSRQKKGFSISDSDFEGKLWKIWSRYSKDNSLNRKILRNIYNYLNNLSYELLEREEERIFKLRPKFRGEVQVNLPGPVDLILTRLGIIVSAMLDKDIELENVILNDHVYELLKALNALDAGFSWDRDRIYRRESSKPLDFDKRAIFIGQDPLNLYLMVFSAISRPGICKLTGDSNLKICDLKPVMNLVSQMGARIVPLIPGSYGLPIRIESTGNINDHIEVDANMPEHALLALLTSCLFYPLKKIDISFAKSSISPHLVERTLYLFDAIEVEYKFNDGNISIYPKEISGLNLGHILDPELSSYLLSLPLLMGGRAEILGNFIEDFSDSKTFLGLFDLSSIDVSPEKIVAKDKISRNKPFIFDIKGIKSVLPLATVFLCSHKMGGEIKGIPESEMSDLRDVLEQLDLFSFEMEEGSLKITHSNVKKKKGIEFYSPDPRWSVALALFSLTGYEIILKNPGEITELWPSFWTYYKSLPNLKYKPRDQRMEDKDEAPKKRRRIIISGDRKTR